MKLLKRVLSFAAGIFAAASVSAAVGTGPGGLFIQRQNTLQSGATFYVSSGTANNFNTNAIKFSDGTTQVTAATSGGGASTMQVMVNGVEISSPTTSLRFDDNFLGFSPSVGISSVSLSPNSTFYIRNGALLQTPGQFHVSSATVAGQFMVSTDRYRVLVVESSTKPFQIINKSSEAAYIIFGATNTARWRFGADPKILQTRDFGLYNELTGIYTIQISSSDVITLNGSVIVSGLTASMPVKTNSSKQLVSGLIDVTADITGTIPSGNLPTNISYNNVQQTVSVNKVYSASQTFNSDVVVTALPSEDCVGTDSTGKIIAGTCTGGSGGDNLGSHVATMTVTAGFGIAASSAVITGTFNAGTSDSLVMIDTSAFSSGGSAQISMKFRRPNQSYPTSSLLLQGLANVDTSTSTYLELHTMSSNSLSQSLYAGYFGGGNTLSLPMTQQRLNFHSSGYAGKPYIYATAADGDLVFVPGTSAQRVQIGDSSASSLAFKFDTSGNDVELSYNGTSNNFTIPSTVTVSGSLAVTSSASVTNQLTVSSIKFPDGTVQVSSPTTSSGDIESVTAGQGLSGGGTSGAVTISLSPNATNYIQVKNSLQNGSTFYVNQGYVDGALYIGSQFAKISLNTNDEYETPLIFASPLPSFGTDATFKFTNSEPGVAVETHLALEAGSSTGTITWNPSSFFSLSHDVSVPDEVYGAGWNNSLEVPTKNALYDKIQTISGGGDNLGSHVATMTITAGSGISASTGVFTSLTASSGTASSPSYSFQDYPTTGFFRPAANEIGVSASGIVITTFTATTVKIKSITWPDGTVQVSSFSLGSNVPLKNADNTWTGRNTFTGIVTDIGTSGTKGLLDIYPLTAAKGATRYVAEANTGDTLTQVITASQSGARMYTIPDVGGSSGTFVFRESSQTFSGGNTFNSSSTFKGPILDRSSGAGSLGQVLASSGPGRGTYWMTPNVFGGEVFKTDTYSAGAGVCTISSGCVSPSQFVTNTSSTNFVGALFTYGTTSYWELEVPLPENYINGSTLTARILYTSTATSGNMLWNVQMKVSSAGTTMDGAFGTNATATGSHLGSYFTSMTSESGAITPAGSLFGGATLFVRLYRGVSASDTITADVIFKQIRITYPIDKVSARD